MRSIFFSALVITHLARPILWGHDLIKQGAIRPLFLCGPLPATLSLSVNGDRQASGGHPRV